MEKNNSCSKLLNKLLDINVCKLILDISTKPPPKKKITNKLDINKILVYSAKKKETNVIAEYSTL
jgi:hypothetical protein